MRAQFQMPFEVWRDVMCVVVTVTSAERVRLLHITVFIITLSFHVTELSARALVARHVDRAFVHPAFARRWLADDGLR